MDSLLSRWKQSGKKLSFLWIVASPTLGCSTRAGVSVVYQIVFGKSWKSCNWDTPESQSELAGVNSSELEKTRWRVIPRLYERACGRSQQCVLVCPCPSISLSSASRAAWLSIPNFLSWLAGAVDLSFPAGLSTGIWEKGHNWLCWHIDETLHWEHSSQKGAAASTNLFVACRGGGSANCAGLQAVLSSLKGLVQMCTDSTPKKKEFQLLSSIESHAGRCFVVVRGKKLYAFHFKADKVYIERL